MLSGTINDFIKLSKFHDLQDFNHQIEQWMLDIRVKFTKSELIGLKRLIRYSAKVPGICNAKIPTLVAACKEMGGISRKTFERMLVKAKYFGLLEVVHTFKKNGKQAHNLYIFHRYFSSSKNDVPELQNSVAPIETDNLLETSKPLNTNNRYEDVAGIPFQFQKVAKIAFSPKQWRELWKAARQEAYHAKTTAMEKILSVGIYTLRVLICEMKKGNIGNPIGYFKIVMRNALKPITARPAAETIRNERHDKLPKWMNAGNSLSKEGLSVEESIQNPVDRSIIPKWFKKDEAVHTMDDGEVLQKREDINREELLNILAGL